MFHLINILLFISNALALLTANKPYYDLADAENLFADFIQKYDKKYESHEEYIKRFENFKNKLIQINKLNEAYDATFGVNKFSDLTSEEFASTRLPILPFKDTNNKHVTEMIKVKKEWMVNAPKHLDYRTQNLVTHVKDEEICSASYMFSAIGNIEGQYAKKHKKLVTLSEQQILDCGKKTGWCCDAYSPLDTIIAASKLDGCVSEEEYPYTGEISTCQNAGGTKVKVKGGKRIVLNNAEELLAAVVYFGPLSIEIFFSSGAESYSGGVLSPTDCNQGYVNHGVLVVGYGTDTESGKDYWILKNNWGSDWGELGYLRLERGINCTYNTAMTSFVE